MKLSAINKHSLLWNVDCGTVISIDGCIYMVVEHPGGWDKANKTRLIVNLQNGVIFEAMSTTLVEIKARAELKY